MKVVYASLIALVSSRSIIDLKPYNLDERPNVTPNKKVTAGDCQVNPWLLLTLFNRWTVDNPTADVKRSTIFKSLVQCKDNQDVKEIFTFDYMLKKKPELWNNLQTNPVPQTGKTLAERSVVDLLDIDSTADGFRKTLKDWSSSKVFMNMYKRKFWADQFNTPVAQRYQYVNRKYDSFKAARDEAKTHSATASGVASIADGFTANAKSGDQKLEQFRFWAPYAKPVANAFRGPKPAVQKVLPAAVVEVEAPPAV